MNFRDTEVANKFQEEYGSKALNFMEFVLAQNMQLDIIKLAMQAAQEKEIEMALQMLNKFTDVHAEMTALFSTTVDLTEEHAIKIFNAANEEYVKQKEAAVRPEQAGKTND
jgi:ribonucleotide reductase beta subunit family protein with ferritin-like domain